MTDDTWTTVTRLRDRLAAHQDLPPSQEILLRVLKLSEEVGEAAQAVIGATGQNPRKGVSHTWRDVEAELCDVVITAMVALRTLTPDAPEVFAAHLRRVAARMEESTPRGAERASRSGAVLTEGARDPGKDQCSQSENSRS